MAHRTKTHPEEAPSAWPFLRKVQWATLILMVTMSELVYLAGHTVLSYAIDAIPVAAFFWIRNLRQS